MQEIKTYYSFFKSSLILLIVGLVIGSLGGYYFYLQESTVYTTEQVFEIRSENISSDDKILLAEEVVGLLREDSVHYSDVQNLYISRISPYAVKVIVSSDNPQTNSENIQFVSRFLADRGSFISVGIENKRTHSPSLLLFTIGGMGVGVLLGLCISLMKTYIRTH